MDVTPSQEMVDEGIAREVVNKIQKLRKKVKGRSSGRKEKWEGRGMGGERDGRIGEGGDEVCCCVNWIGLSSLGRLDYSYETQWRVGVVWWQPSSVSSQNTRTTLRVPRRDQCVL